jgi:hypothetical protein
MQETTSLKEDKWLVSFHTWIIKARMYISSIYIEHSIFQKCKHAIFYDFLVTGSLDFVTALISFLVSFILFSQLISIAHFVTSTFLIFPIFY